jgi:hypothetical protein
MEKKHIVKLSEEERTYLAEKIAAGTNTARSLRRNRKISSLSNQKAISWKRVERNVEPQKARSNLRTLFRWRSGSTFDCLDMQRSPSRICRLDFAAAERSDGRTSICGKCLP